MALFVSFLSGIAFFYAFAYFPYAASAVALASAVFFLLRKTPFYAAAVAAGIAYALLRTWAAGPHSEIKAPREITATGTVSSSPSETPSGFRQDMDIHTAADEDTGERLGISEVALFSKIPLKAGRSYEFRALLHPLRQRQNPGGFESRTPKARLMEIVPSKNGSSISAFFIKARDRLNRAVLSSMAEEPASLVMAVTTGERGLIPEGLKEAFGSSGLAHVLSISGTHFGLFSVLLFALLKLSVTHLPARFLRRITMHISPSQAASVLCLPFMAFYLGLSGGSVPTIRSFVMISVFLLGLIIGKKRHWLNSLFFAAVIVALLEPSAILTLPFQLSFSAVLFMGFITLGRAEEAERKPLWRRALSLPALPLKLTVAATLGTALLAAYHFHYASLVSPLSNMTATPVIGFVLVPLSLLSSFVFFATGHYPFPGLIEKTAEASIGLARLFSSIPYASAGIREFPPALLFFYYGGFTAYFIWRKRLLLAIPLLPLIFYCFIASGQRGELSVTFLDVGLADSAVVELPDGKTIVIDAGNTGREASGYLRSKAVERIDALVLSHADGDHSGGAGHLIEKFAVSELWDNGSVAYTGVPPKSLTQRSLRRGDVMGGGAYEMQVFHPYEGFSEGYGEERHEGNNSSLVLRLSGNGASFLFAGDIEEEAEEDISLLGARLKSDVLKVPHHGGRSSANAAFLKAVSPGISVISSEGAGRPHSEMLDALRGSAVFMTAAHGAVKTTATGGGISTKTYAEFRLRKAGGIEDEKRNIKRLFSVW